MVLERFGRTCSIPWWCSGNQVYKGGLLLYAEHVIFWLSMARKRRKRTTSTAAKTTRKRARTPKVEVRLSKEALAILFVLLLFLTVASLQNAAGPLGESWKYGLSMAIGIWGAYLLVGLSLLLGFLGFVFRLPIFTQARLFGVLLLSLSFLSLVHLMGGIDPSIPVEESIRTRGGAVGFSIAVLLTNSIAGASQYVLVMTLLLGIVMTFEISPRDLWYFFVSLFTEETEAEKVTSPVKERVFSKQKLRSGSTEEEKSTAKDDFTVVTSKSRAIAEKEGMTVVGNQERKKKDFNIQDTIDENYHWEFPSIDLLDNPDAQLELDDAYLRLNAQKISDKLQQFGISVKVRDVKVGPTVMQYSLEPAEDVKLSKITALRDDLKLALAADSLRIEAPIPGKSLVGVEMPNEQRVNVRLKELLLSNDFYAVQSNLRMPLGKDVSGTPIIADLATMPHLLIAGQTGSGKSVGINAIIMSLLYQNSPRDLRLILVDPKRVELKVYNHIPHLLTPVITEVDKAVNALRWMVTEMNRRYTLLEEVSARNRAEYNEKVATEKKLPHIVCIIDELAELMMSGDKKSIEGYICRIAQLARAVGMHLIVATQRPSVDVITGLIKANIPARISFRVASSIDSRTILDMIGAEDLLGKGDMLYIPGNVSEPIRVQCANVPTPEVERVVNAIKLTPSEEDEVQYVEEITQSNGASTLAGSMFAGEDSPEDDLLNEAIDVLRGTGKASTSLLQRRLKIGYSRAARMLDLLEEKGIVGPADGSKPRKVFLDGGSEPANVPEDDI